MSEPECKKCGRPYMLTNGDEPTPYCDRCAHLMVESLERDVEKVNNYREELRGKYHQAIDECAELRAEVEGLRKRLQNQAEMLSNNECEINQLRAEVERLTAFCNDRSHAELTLKIDRDQWRAVAGLLAASQKCPNCDDVGWFIEWRRLVSGEGEPEHRQCEFCYTTQNSRFNALAAYEKLKGQP